jgi:hypothetical protein
MAGEVALDHLFVWIWECGLTWRLLESSGH